MRPISDAAPLSLGHAWKHRFARSSAWKHRFAKNISEVKCFGTLLPGCWIEEGWDARRTAVPELVSKSRFQAGDQGTSRPDSFLAARTPGRRTQEECGREGPESKEGSDHPVREPLQRTRRCSRV